MKQIAKIELVHLNRMDYVIDMLTRTRNKVAKIYEPDDIHLLIKPTMKNTVEVIFYLMERLEKKCVNMTT